MSNNNINISAKNIINDGNVLISDNINLIAQNNIDNKNGA
ncbi:hypothetical protein, partial [Streptobacillus felis]